MSRSTSRPAYSAASLVALRCTSLKCAGTEITACFTGSPRFFSATSRTRCEDLRRDLDRRELGALHLEQHAAERARLQRVGQARGGLAHLVRVERVPDQPLHGEDRGLRRGHGVALGGGADQLLAALHRHTGRDGRARLVRQHDRLAVLRPRRRSCSGCRGRFRPLVPPSSPIGKGSVLGGLRRGGCGGDERDRTADLCVANAALSQLSYIPAGERA